MKYSCKSTFGATLLKALETTALGTLVSIRDNNGTDILTINIGPLEIPQYPVNPVRRIECVEIIAVDNELPVVFCREDFPIVPHLNVLENGKKTLCLFDVSFEDVKYMFNANMFLRRIVYWFEETARGQLHQPDQPLEPYFPGAKDIIVLPLHSDGNPFIRLRKVQMPHGVLYQAVPVENVSDGQIYTVLPIEIKKTLSENIINKMPQTLGELDDAFNESIIDSLEQYIPQIWSVKQTALYKKLFQQKEKELRHSAVIIILWISLARTCDADPEGLTIKAFQLSENFQTLYQTFGYRKDTKGKLLKLQSEDKHSNLPLIPYEVMFSFDRASAHLYSGYSVSETEGNYVQIGLGALGSQIANNCIRAGYGKWTYVDSDTVFPHNLARHCLDQAYIGQNKAQAMLDYANTLTGTYDSSVLKAISHDVLNINAKDTLVSKRISSLLAEVSRLSNALCAMNTMDLQRYPENYELLSTDAALRAEQIACRMRHLVYGFTTVQKHEYLTSAANVLGITITAQPGLVEITLPGLLPKKKQRSAEYLTDPLEQALGQFVKDHPLSHFESCIICFCHIYAVSGGRGRIRDYDNLEMKQILDVVCAYLMMDDNGLLCNVYNTTELGEEDVTKLFVMDQDMFPGWLEEHQNALETMSDF